MIFLLLTILCSSSLALILKHGNVKKSHAAVLINANYIVASLASLVILLTKGGFHFSADVILFGCIVGSLFAITFFLYSKAVGLAGTALATVSARLSVIIPVILSIIVFAESPDLKMMLGFLLTLVTFYLFYLSLRNDKNSTNTFIKYLFLAGLLLGIGVNDFALKLFEANYSVEQKGTFVFFIFFSAYVYTLIYLLVKKIQFEKHAFGLGLVLGVPNVLATHFLLIALSQLPAIVVFPVLNIGVILVTALSAYIIWREKLNSYGIAALIVGIGAILLLKL